MPSERQGRFVPFDNRILGRTREKGPLDQTKPNLEVMVEKSTKRTQNPRGRGIQNEAILTSKVG